MTDRLAPDIETRRNVDLERQPYVLCTAERDDMGKYGRASLRVGRDDVDNPSAHLLVVVSPEEDVELLLWADGHAEFNRGPFADSEFEHVVMGSSADLDQVLARFVAALAGER